MACFFRKVMGRTFPLIQSRRDCHHSSNGKGNALVYRVLDPQLSGTAIWHKVFLPNKNLLIECHKGEYKLQSPDYEKCPIYFQRKETKAGKVQVTHEKSSHVPNFLLKEIEKSEEKLKLLQKNSQFINDEIKDCQNQLKRNCSRLWEYMDLDKTYWELAENERVKNE